MYVINAIIAYTTYSKKFNEAHIVLLHEAGSTDNTFLYHPINLHQALVENLIWYSTCPYIKEDKFCRNEHAFTRCFWYLKNTFFSITIIIIAKNAVYQQVRDLFTLDETKH